MNLCRMSCDAHQRSVGCLLTSADADDEDDTLTTNGGTLPKMHLSSKEKAGDYGLMEDEARYSKSQKNMKTK